jgi:hypothetical protein
MLSIKQLPYPKEGFNNADEHLLHDDLCLEQWVVPAGTVVKLVTTRNFGIVILPQRTVDKRGFVIPRQLFKW